MGGFKLVAITCFVIWSLGKIMAEKPGDSDKQDPWHRFKGRFKAGRVYFLFAARTKERMFRELFVFYLVGGLLFLFAIDSSISKLMPIPQLEQLVVIEGTLASVSFSKGGCGHKAVIQSQQKVSTFDFCWNTAKDKRRLDMIVNKPVKAWIDFNDGTFLDHHTSIHQLGYQNELLIDYAEIKRNKENARKDGWVYFSLIPILVSGWCFWCVAIINKRKFGTQLPH